MSYKRFDPQDLVISVDSISSTIWSTNNPSLTTFFTSSVQEGSSTGGFYLTVYQTASTSVAATSQFSIVYGDINGSGSTFYNTVVTGSSPSRTIYGQYRNLILADESSSFTFAGVTSSYFWAINIDRARYKEHLLPGSLTLAISGTTGVGGGVIQLTDDSAYTTVVSYTDAGRTFNLISGSAGVRTSTPKDSAGLGYTENSGSYGYFLPDVGIILLNGEALSGSVAGGGIALPASRSINAPGLNERRLFTAISRSATANFRLNSQESLASNYVFVRARSNEFNYSENPSYIASSNGSLTWSDFAYNPLTYITTIGMYNDNNELLAVAKLSRPLHKDFTKELLVRVKLDF
jgi:hypothetical protein